MRRSFISFACALLISGCSSIKEPVPPQVRATNTAIHSWHEFNLRSGMSTDDLIREVGLPIRYVNADDGLFFVYFVQHHRKIRLKFIPLEDGGFSTIVGADVDGFYKGKRVWWHIFDGDPNAPHATYVAPRAQFDDSRFH